MLAKRLIAVPVLLTMLGFVSTGRAGGGQRSLV